jgi:hypothetical protein
MVDFATATPQNGICRTKQKSFTYCSALVSRRLYKKDEEDERNKKLMFFSE